MDVLFRQESHSLRLPAKAKLPVLRGTIYALSPWRDDPKRPGYQYRSAQIAVWCPYCCRMHFHGWDMRDNGRVLSHRAAHCREGSPLRDTGYYIAVWRVSDTEHKAHVAPPGKEITRKIPDWLTQHRAARAHS